jgi:hypothetical protein
VYLVISWRVLVFGLVGAVLASPAQAQIYMWTDANGTVTLSDRPKPGATGDEVRTFSVPKSQDMRTTRYVAPDRARAYDSIIDDHARLHGIRPDLVRAVVQVESAFNRYAVSPKGAQGLMQLMPATARQFGVVDVFDPEDNVRAGVAYLRQLLDRYDNNEALALAAYNAGPQAVAKYGERVPPYRETQNYVSKISKMAGPPVRVPGTTIYKITEIVDGREVVRYTDKKPAVTTPQATTATR